MNLVYLISADKIGNQDQELGKQLMINFLRKLLEAEKKPSHLLLVERGVHLILEDFPAFEAIMKLEESGVEILVCQTCIQYYKLEEKVAAGKIANMPTIISKMHEADKVISL